MALPPVTIPGNIPPDLNSAEAIVDPATGKPSFYFMDYLQARGGYLSSVEQTLQTLYQTIGSQTIAAGGALTGGGLVFADPPTSINLAALAPPPTGSFTNANITVDQYGRVTAAANGSTGTVSVKESFFVGQANAGAFGSRGGQFTPLKNCKIKSLFAKFTADPLVTYQCHVVTLTGGTTVATIVDSVTIGPGLSAAAYTLQEFQFASPLNLTAGTAYGIIFTRNTTAGSTAWSMQGTSGSGLLNVPGFAIIDTYIRATVNTVTVGQVYTTGANSYWFGVEFL